MLAETVVGAPLVGGFILGVGAGYLASKGLEWFFTRTGMGHTITTTTTTVDKAVGNVTEAVGNVASKGWRKLQGLFGGG